MSTLAQRSLAAGEISPSVYSRCDTTKYQQGLRKLRNGHVKREGGIKSRNGTVFIGECRTPTEMSRLITFDMDSSAFVLEMAPLAIRVIANTFAPEIATIAGKTISGITQATEAVVTSATHGLANGTRVFIENVVGMTELNGRQFIVSDQATNTFKIKYLNGTYVNSTAFTAYGSAGTAYPEYKITSTYTESALRYIQYAQDAFDMVFAHSDYDVKLAIKGSTLADPTDWSFGNMGHTSPRESDGSFLGKPSSPANGGGAGTNAFWVITGYDPITGEETEQVGPTSSTTVPTSGSPVAVTWTNAPGSPPKVRIYRRKNGIYGYVGVADGPGQTFSDVGVEADTTMTPPVAGVSFGNTAGTFPAVCGFIQQRLALACVPASAPSTIWMSAVSSKANFLIRTPPVDSDLIVAKLANSGFSSIRHVIELSKPVIMTSKTVQTLNGGDSGALLPTEINPATASAIKSAQIPQALRVGEGALVVEARGSAVKDLSFQISVDGYQGQDLTTFSKHLFRGYQIVDWAHQENPDSIVWMVRSDGALISMTYIKEQQINGFGLHTFQGGEVEAVCVAPFFDYDYVYLTIKRTINGETKRYIERMATNQDVALEARVHMDSALTYDGENQGGPTMTISGGTNWDQDEILTITAGSSFFSASEIGNAIHLTGSDGTLIRFSLTEYTSTTVMKGIPHKEIPVVMRSTAISTWSRAVDRVTGLWHLEGEDVSVFADGSVIASPNNPNYTVITVSGGAINLARPYAIITVGLPFTFDAETLDIDSANGETLADKKKIVTKVSMNVEETASLFVGQEEPTGDDMLENLNESKLWQVTNIGDPVELKTEVVDVAIESNWDSNGRVFIRQVDPLPVTINSILPDVMAPFRK